MFYVTGRFNNETRETNYAYRKKHNLACIYCCPTQLSPKIYYNAPVFVIEMNNSTNKLEGIGLIKNNCETQKYFKVHSDSNTNRYTYIGKYFIERDIIDHYNSHLVFVLEQILFKGKTHSKRGSGLTLFPEKVINNVLNKVIKMDISEGIDIKKEIKQLFIYQFREKLHEEQEQV